MSALLNDSILNGITPYLPIHTGTHNRIGGVMVSVLASSAVDRGFEPR
jgi:hypothetical protein